MNCLICKNGTMTDSFETYFAKLKTGYAIIENVPCKKCEQCGEILFSASVIEKIEKRLKILKKFRAKFLFLITKQQHKFIHLTSDKDKKVVEKISEVSKKLFERNREAYRILANK